MKYTVTWRPKAETTLTQMWLGGRDRQSIQEAAERIEQQLANWPLEVGESRVGNHRILIDDPLAVVYSVWPQDQVVKVVEVTRTRLQRGQG